MNATASTTTSAGETFRAALGSGGKGESSTQAERSVLVEAVRGSSSSAIRLRRVRARAGGIARRVWRSAIFHSWESARGDSLLISNYVPLIVGRTLGRSYAGFNLFVLIVSSRNYRPRSGSLDRVVTRRWRTPGRRLRIKTSGRRSFDCEYHCSL